MSKKERLIYLPLGGAGEIGMNAYVYGYGAPGKERLILVECGVTFPDMDHTPGVDLIMADMTWLAERRDRLEAIFITHGHEDHVGALGLIWPLLKAPVHARPFTATLARGKMERNGRDTRMIRKARPWPEMIEAGPFKVGFVPLSHSIPESSALVIDTPAGRIVHSGDFKIDTTPVVGEPFDHALMTEIGKTGVLALMCDSTNVFSSHPGRSEASLAEPLKELVAGAKGLVVATTFASNVARLKTLAEAASAAGRKLAVVGRAMNTMLSAARETQILGGFPAVISLEEARDTPRHKLMVLATGSQGERRAATAQLAAQGYMGLQLKPGDTLVFSSKTIPGNEKPVAHVLNLLAQQDVDVIHDNDAYHVSGHANRPDIERMQELVNPKIVIPMHGEYRHLRELSKVTIGLGRETVIAPNGTMVEISDKGAKVVERFDQGRTYLDGEVLIGAGDGVVRQRLNMAMRGHVAVSLMIEDGGKMVGNAWAELSGLPEKLSSHEQLAEMIEAAIDDDLARLPKRDMRDDAKVEDATVKAVRRICRDALGKKPECTVMISRVD